MLLKRYLVILMSLIKFQKHLHLTSDTRTVHNLLKHFKLNLSRIFNFHVHVFITFKLILLALAVPTYVLDDKLTFVTNATTVLKTWTHCPSPLKKIKRDCKVLFYVCNIGIYFIIGFIVVVKWNTCIALWSVSLDKLWPNALWNLLLSWRHF